jgi:CheY-like chemotaxis protein
MRLKILSPPTGDLDGISLSQFHVGEVYTVGMHVGCVLLVEGWAELVTEAGTPVFADAPGPATIAQQVLVVDDDPDVLGFTQTLLTAHGYHVIVARHGKDAIHRLRAWRPDLIVLDLNMPVMNGWDFCAEQRNLADVTRARAPVLVMSGDNEAETHAATLHAIGVIKKPFAADDLLQAVSAAIGSHRQATDGIQAARPPRPPRV